LRSALASKDAIGKMQILSPVDMYTSIDLELGQLAIDSG